MDMTTQPVENGAVPDGFGIRLASVALWCGLTNDKEAAMAFGYAPSTWRGWLHGKPPRREMEAVCRRVVEVSRQLRPPGVSYIWLISGESPFAVTSPASSSDSGEAGPTAPYVARAAA